MLGHKWEPATGTIVNAETLSPGSGRGSADRPVHRYFVELQRPGNGEYVRGIVDERHEFRRPLDSTIRVQVRSHSDEMRLDPDDPGPSVGMINIEQQMRDTAAAASRFGSGAHVQVASASVHLAGQNAADLQGEDISELVHAMMSGDPAARQAAAERIREIKARAQQRADEHQNQAAAAGSAFGQPAPGPFDAFEPAGGDQASFGSFGSFGTGTGRGTPEQRLTALKQLLDKGILTESEYHAKRQQIISEL